MCEHDYKIVKTTSTHFIKKCLKCNDVVIEERIKNIKKKSLIDKLLRR